MSISFNDKNISQKFFSNYLQEARIEKVLSGEVAPTKLAVASIFGPTIQGEGPFAGQPAIFLRLAGCNRGKKDSKAGCSFCDADFRIDNARWMTTQEIIAEIDTLAGTFEGGNTRLLVVTGGEPLLQNFYEFAVVLSTRTFDLFRKGVAIDPDQYNFQVQVETNGDYAPEWALWLLSHSTKFQVVVSPKIGNGQKQYPKAKGFLQPTMMGNPKFPGLYLKTLISADDKDPYYDLHPIIQNLKYSIYEGAGKQIFLSPIAVYAREMKEGEVPSVWDPTLYDREKTAANYARAAKLAFQYGVRVSLQTHLMLGVP